MPNGQKYEERLKSKGRGSERPAALRNPALRWAEGQSQTRMTRPEASLPPLTPRG